MVPLVPRVSRVAGIAAIVATVTLLVVGVVAGQPGAGQPASTAEVALSASAAPDAPTTVTVHTHDSTVAAVTGTPTTTHDHGTDAVAVEGASAHAGHADAPAAAGSTATATTAHDHHVDVPVASASPGVSATVPAHDHGTVTTIPGDTTPTTIHDHGGATTVPPSTVPGTPTTTTTLPTGPIISVTDARLTAAQRAAAVDLIARTKAAMHAFPDEAAVLAAGYLSIGDGGTGFEHFVRVDYLTDAHEVDPQHIESIVLRTSGATKTVESAMYILTTGKTMADVPDIAGELTTWHDHQNLCWIGLRVVGVTDANGHCARGEFRPTAPMLHVWMTEQPCGPFAGIDGHGTGCHNH